MPNISWGLGNTLLTQKIKIVVIPKNCYSSIYRSDSFLQAVLHLFMLMKDLRKEGFNKGHHYKKY